jgi:hypothetical protein
MFSDRALQRPVIALVFLRKSREGGAAEKEGIVIIGRGQLRPNSGLHWSVARVPYRGLACGKAALLSFLDAHPGSL